jgi:tripartite-type tricarboxylate transporter receptor subunit TctC
MSQWRLCPLLNPPPQAREEESSSARRNAPSPARRGKSGMGAILAAFLLLALSAFAATTTFPTKPVRFVVGYAPGGGADTLARIIARALSEKWTQAVVVENRAGAGGVIAANLVANAPADGYTFLLITTNHTVPSTEFKTASYDPVKSFTPIIEIAYIPSALLVNPAIRAGSLKELIELAKSKPGELNFGSTGPGTAQFMDMHLLMRATGMKLVNVTYKGAGPILIALLANEIQLTVQPITAYLETIKAGKVKALAVTGATRSRLLPGVPTYTETGAARGFEATENWYGIVAPAGLSKDIVRKLHDDVVSAINAADVQRLMADQGYVTVAGSPEQFANRIVSDLSKWSKLLKSVDTK